MGSGGGYLPFAGYRRARVISEDGVRVHVVPAVEVQSLCSLRPLNCEAGLCCDPTRSLIQGRVVQFQAMKASRDEGPVDDCPESQRRDPLSSGSGKDPVRHPRAALISADTA